MMLNVSKEKVGNQERCLTKWKHFVAVMKHGFKSSVRNELE